MARGRWGLASSGADRRRRLACRSILVLWEAISINSASKRGLATATYSRPFRGFLETFRYPLKALLIDSLEDGVFYTKPYPLNTITMNRAWLQAK